ncbi:putative chitin binding peritrophin-A [Trypoxylus dichotomus]
MRFVNVCLMFTAIGGLCRYGQATCVLESDFGFVINCAFKKSGLFRVRNLGGVKAHIGLGFSLGDDLGFKQSFANTERDNRRRSASASPFVAQAALMQQVRKSNPNVSLSNKLQASTVPPFKPIPPAPERPILTTATATTMSANATKLRPKKEPTIPVSMGIAVPAFNSIPSSSISRISHGATVPADAKAPPQIAIIMPVKKQAADKMSSSFALRTLPTEQVANFPAPIAQTDSNYVHNISESVLEEAIAQRQTTSTTAPISTTSKPKYYKHSTIGKVMNAPKEYYPVGYDKNFDDNFSSRVDLPETSFRCGDQKHFPGLYADEDLGCMVFHVCALTDDGLIMKSFLCPESTLFDQTILKCNWWFYVDCKNSRKLYDSNIPISKSYQLMKALTFFSSYKKESQNNNNGRQITNSMNSTKTVTKD